MTDEHYTSQPLQSFIPEDLRIICGSQSHTRFNILKKFGVRQIHCIPANINEQDIGNRDGDPETLVLELAKVKASTILHTLPNDILQNYMGWILLTGDQVILYGNSILEKPQNEQHVYDLYKAFSTPDAHGIMRPILTIGANILTDVKTRIQVSEIEISEIRFTSKIPDEDIAQLLPECLQCAGGLMIEHPVIASRLIISRGTQDSVMGLGIESVRSLLDILQEKIISA